MRAANRVRLGSNAGEVGSSRSRAPRRGSADAARAELLADRRRIRRRRPHSLVHAPGRGPRHGPAAARLRGLRANALVRHARDRGRGSPPLLPRAVAPAGGGPARRLLAAGMGRGLGHARPPERLRARRRPRRARRPADRGRDRGPDRAAAARRPLRGGRARPPAPRAASPPRPAAHRTGTPTVLHLASRRACRQPRRPRTAAAPPSRHVNAAPPVRLQLHVNRRL